ncbi:YceI family protein [Labilibacter sediminis]|nr:YceI family protein [Labilibacter sediminis]
MKRLALFGLVLIIQLPLLLGIAQNKFKAISGNISFFSSAPLEDIYADNNKIKSLLDIDSKEIAFIVSISEFNFKKSLMQTHFNEKYMESHKYPNALYQGKLISNSDLKTEGIHKVTSKGEITIHGVKKEIEVTGTLHNKGREIQVKSEFNIKLADFKIKIPKLIIKNIAEEVLVKVDIVYQ